MKEDLVIDAGGFTGSNNSYLSGWQILKEQTSWLKKN